MTHDPSAKTVKSTGKARAKPYTQATATTAIPTPTAADLAKSIIQALQLDPEGDDDDDELQSGSDEDVKGYGLMDGAEGSSDNGETGEPDRDGGDHDGAGSSQPRDRDCSEDESGECEEEEDADI